MGAGVFDAVSEYACEGGFVSSSDWRLDEFEDGTVRMVEVVEGKVVLEGRDRSESAALTCASAGCELLLLRL